MIELLKKPKNRTERQLLLERQRKKGTLLLDDLFRCGRETALVEVKQPLAPLADSLASLGGEHCSPAHESKISHRFRRRQPAELPPQARECFPHLPDFSQPVRQSPHLGLKRGLDLANAFFRNLHRIAILNKPPHLRRVIQHPYHVVVQWIAAQHIA